MTASQARRLTQHEDVLLLPSTVKMPLMKLPLTTVALRTSRGVLLISPGKETQQQAESISKFGRVTDLIAPNLLHHKSIHLAQNEFPQATVWGVEGFKKKRPDVSWDKTLTAASWNYGDEVQVVELRGVPVTNECVFFHEASKTLVVTDLFFNLVDAKGLGSWVILKMFDTYRRFAISKLYLKGVTDREAFKASLREMMKFNFETVVMSHGSPVTTNARQAVEAALSERDLL